MSLNDMLYVSYLLPQERIAKLLPYGLRPALVEGGNVFLSLVIFKGNTKEAFRVPAPPIPFDQVNIRTYVTDPQSGRPAVYFIKCGINGRFITFMYRALSGMPVEHCPFKVSVAAGRNGHYGSYLAEGWWRGPFYVGAEGTDLSLTDPGPFKSVKEALEYLMEPRAGFYPSRGSLRRLEIFHEPLTPKVCRAVRVDIPYLEELGLLSAVEISAPHNVLFVPHTPFEIFLPPEKQ